MAEIRDTLILEIDNALRDVGRIETALDRALAPVEVEIDIDERGIEALEDVLREVERIAERASTETQSIALAAGRAEVNFEDLARAMGVTEAQARDLTSELLQSQAASNRLEDSARDVARQLGLSDREAERLAGSLREADRAADAIDVAAIGLGTRFAALRSSAVLIAGALAGVGIGAGLALAVTGANTAIQSFARLEDSINAVNVVFGVASSSVLQFGEDAAASAGLSQEAFNQAVVPIGSLLQNFGFDAREAADAAVILVQRGADLASVYGGSVNDALLAVGAALRGEADPLERYGASISAARVETFALAEGLARTKAEITPAIALQARYGLILSDTAAVSGDFANTSDDLANAQRSAGAAVQNFVSDIGETLAPALESILVLLPEVLEGVRQLVPGFAAAAGSAAAFAESIGEGGGFRTEFAAIKAGFDVVTGGAGLAVEASSLFSAGLRGDFTEVAAAAQRGGALIERAFGRGIAVTLANSLDSGTDALVAFKTAITQTAATSSNFQTFTGNYRDFSVAAGLSALELRDVTQELITNADTMGLTADEVSFLITQLALLNSFLFEDIEAIREFNRAQRELAEDPGFETVTTRFTTFASGVEEGTDRAATALAELAAAAEAQQARTAAAFDLFAELPDKIKGSFSDAVDELREQVNAAVDFDINIAILRALNLDALADEFQTQGIAAAGQLQQALEDIPAAIEADTLLQGFATDIAEGFFDDLVDRLTSLGLTPSDAKALAETLSSPQVIAAAQEAGVIVATQQTESYHDRLTEAVDQLIPEVGQNIGRSIETHWVLEEQAAAAATTTGESFLDGIVATVTPDAVKSALDLFGIDIDLTEVGKDAGYTLITGMVIATSSSESVNRLRSSITETIDSAIYRDSPPKLFLDIGKESGDAYWAGFGEVESQTVVVPPIDIPEVVIPPIDIPPIDIPEVVIPPIELPEIEAAIDLLVQGVDARASFFDGLSTALSGEVSDLRASITATLDSAISRDSPPKLFLDAGIESGEAFWSGFNQSDLTLRTALPPVTGSITTGSGSTVAAGGVNVNINLDNARLNDAVSDVARMAQIAGSVAHTYNAVRN